MTHDPDITRLLDRLEARGLVERARQEKDRRAIIAKITDAGLRILRKLDDPIEEFHQRTLGPLGESRLRLLVRLLDRVAETSC